MFLHIISVSVLSRGGVLAHRCGFGTFSWIGAGRSKDSETGELLPSSACSKEAGFQLEEYTSSFWHKQTDSDAFSGQAGTHQGPGPGVNLT